MQLETEFESFKITIDVNPDENYKSAKNSLPHSNKDLKLLDKGILKSFQIFVTVKGEETAKLYLPTILLPNESDQEELLEAFQIEFDEVLFPMVLEYLEGIEFPGLKL